MRVLDKALLKTGLIDENEYAARELYNELSHGEMESDGYSPAMKVLAGLGIGAVGSVAAPAIVQSVDNAYAGEMVAKKAEAAEAHATEAHAYANKKIRILVKPFEVTGDYIKRRDVGTTTYSGNDEGLAVKGAIEDDLIDSQNRGRFSKVFCFVQDTERPDGLEADILVNGTLHKDGNTLEFFARVVDAETGVLKYSTSYTREDKVGSVTLGGRVIAGRLDNYLDNNIDDL